MEETLRRLQLTELEILKAVHEFCVQHDIRYSLYAGTMLGAVRHQGFIPWDDDIDICMPRSEYDRFIKLWKENPVEGYTLQNKDNSPAFISSFTKIRKDHTTFLEHKEDIGRFHTGIFIDIFPLDRIPSAWLPKRLFYLRCMLYQLMVREYAPTNCGRVIRLGSKAILAVVRGKNRRLLKNALQRKLTGFDHDKRLSVVDIAEMHSLRVEYPGDTMDAFCELLFEDSAFSVFSAWHTMLSRYFGDYMQLPPEEDRTWTHHPVCIDFDRSAEEIFGS